MFGRFTQAVGKARKTHGKGWNCVINDEHHRQNPSIERKRTAFMQHPRHFDVNLRRRLNQLWCTFFHTVCHARVRCIRAVFSAKSLLLPHSGEGGFCLRVYCKPWVTLTQACSFDGLLCDFGSSLRIGHRCVCARSQPPARPRQPPGRRPAIPDVSDRLSAAGRFQVPRSVQALRHPAVPRST